MALGIYFRLISFASDIDGFFLRSDAYSFVLYLFGYSQCVSVLFVNEYFLYFMIYPVYILYLLWSFILMVYSFFYGFLPQHEMKRSQL